jgi:hypothetical protein
VLDYFIPIRVKPIEIDVAVGVDQTCHFYLTVTLFARFRGLSGSRPRSSASS